MFLIQVRKAEVLNRRVVIKKGGEKIVKQKVPCKGMAHVLNKKTIEMESFGLILIYFK